MRLAASVDLQQWLVSLEDLGLFLASSTTGRGNRNFVQDKQHWINARSPFHVELLVKGGIRKFCKGHSGLVFLSTGNAIVLLRKRAGKGGDLALVGLGLGLCCFLVAIGLFGMEAAAPAILWFLVFVGFEFRLVRLHLLHWLLLLLHRSSISSRGGRCSAVCSRRRGSRGIVRVVL